MKLDVILNKLKINSLREQQKTAIKAVIQGHNTLALLPTGFGKSAIFQIPALLETQLTIVISPLIATIDDQVDTINQAFGQPVAIAWHSKLSREQKQTALESVRDAHLFYCSPESLLRGGLLKQLMDRCSIKRIVIDEVHLISLWGENFRPLYRGIRKSVDPQLKVQWVALSATLSMHSLKQVEQEIGTDFVRVAINPIQNNIRYERHALCTEIRKPNLKTLLTLKKTGTKSNSFYKDSLKMVYSVTQVLRPGDKTLIFCSTRKRVDIIAALLRENGTVCDKYHAGLNYQTRMRVLEDIRMEKSGTIVCTNAFGVGIDVPGVNCVIHVEIPNSIDEYIQETGRAGRNNTCARAILLTDRTISTKSANSLFALSYPQSQHICSVLNYMRSNENLKSDNDKCVTREIGVNPSTLRSVITYLTNNNYVVPTNSLCYVLNDGSNSFNLATYDSMRREIKSQLATMKDYAYTDQGEAEFLTSFFEY